MCWPAPEFIARMIKAISTMVKAYIAITLTCSTCWLESRSKARSCAHPAKVHENYTSSDQHLYMQKDKVTVQSSHP